MAGRGVQFGLLDPNCSFHLSHSQVFILGLILAYYTTFSSHVEASSVRCKSMNISSKQQQCGNRPGGVHDLDCFGEHILILGISKFVWKCVWKPGNSTSEKTYTLIIQQDKKYCRAYLNIAEISAEIKIHQRHNLTVEVFENGESTNCTKAVFRGSPQNLIRCDPPYNASFRRYSGRLVVNVNWQKEDIYNIEYYSVRYKALGSLSWNESPVQSQNREKCTVENLNSSLVYIVQIQCITNTVCSQCVRSEDYIVPSELTIAPVIVKVEDADIAGKKGSRLLSLAWKFPAKEQYDGFFVTIGKASGEAPLERMNITQPEIRLILSYSAYHLHISAVNSASTSPAVSQIIQQRADEASMGAGKLNVTVHSNTSFTVYWQENLIKNYVCYCVEWMKKGHKAAYMSFHEDQNNYRTLPPLPEPLESYKRYSIILHRRPNKDTCNMKHINNSESTYGSTQFYFTEGSPVSGPTNISCHNVTLNSVVLHWSSIPEDDIRGFLLGYIIHYIEYHHKGTHTEKNITMDPVLNSYELGDLKSGTAYEVQVSAFTKAGAGVRSTACLFTTKGQSNLTAIITVFAVMAAVLIFGSPIIKRAKVVLWPSIPNPGNSNAMQKIEGPCKLDLLESINTLKVEEWDTNSLQIVEKEDAALPSASMLPLLDTTEGEEDTEDSEDTEDASGDSLPDITAETISAVQPTGLQTAPRAFLSGYTTMEMFQQAMPQGAPANTSATQTAQSEPELTDLAAAKPGLDYVRQFSTSPTSEEMSEIL